ncbi:MAG TPA: hypothetical protein VLK22_01560 [Candidatus Udaeobacter sp.]|nr:hypothetical protein [Candidatus Udaeobacter sp.]
MGYYFDQEFAKQGLKEFFKDEKTNLNSFGNKVNQTFEAYTFVQTVKWFKDNGWLVQIVNPKMKGRRIFNLKFSTRGAPSKYSYFICKKNGLKYQIRHQLRVSTKAHRDKNLYRSNICCDVVIMNDVDLESYSTDTALPNKDLISFGEVKHMSAFAELVAGFIGMVYELQPGRLKKIRNKKWRMENHLSPYMNVSGHLYNTAKGLDETIKKRKFDIDIYSFDNPL